MVRPVWLFSLDTEFFPAVPMTTGRLKAYHQKYGQSQADVELVHFFEPKEVPAWVEGNWTNTRWYRRFFGGSMLERAHDALKQGIQPIAGFSVYTWNAEVFLETTRNLKQRCPELVVVAGGPHVQNAEDYLYTDGIDVVVLGEGEQTFQELLDCKNRSDWRSIKGLAFLEHGKVVKTEARERTKLLDDLPSALEVVPLTDSDGEPLYKCVAYETTRGCPFKCSFCEWGTGAIGTKMFQHSLDRIRSDLEKLVAGGIRDIWLCDSNFGALREDLDKAKIILDLKERTGRPAALFASWSKNHNQRVQQIALLLQRNGLLTQYVLSLQTLTPLALKLSNRQNMRNNEYEPIVKRMTEEKVPIHAELIWGLPGDNRKDFEANLDHLCSVFPHIYIHGYTMLPGTEFFDRRDEYEVETIPVDGYGKAKGEYVIGCHTFSREEGLEGYFSITAYMMLVRGHIMPLTIRFLALSEHAPISGLLRAALRAAVDAYAPKLKGIDWADYTKLYENRTPLYRAVMDEREVWFDTLKQVVHRWLEEYGADAALKRKTIAVFELDRVCAPREQDGEVSRSYDFDFDALTVWRMLHTMEVPDEAAFARREFTMLVEHDGMTNPDVGSSFQGRPRIDDKAAAQNPAERAVHSSAGA